MCDVEITFSLLQLWVLRFGLLQDRNIRFRVKYIKVIGSGRDYGEWSRECRRIRRGLRLIGQPP